MRARVARLQRCYTDTARPLRCKRPAVQHAAALHPCASRALHCLSITRSRQHTAQFDDVQCGRLTNVPPCQGGDEAARAHAACADIKHWHCIAWLCSALGRCLLQQCCCTPDCATPAHPWQALMHARSARQLSGACGSGGATRLHVHANHCRPCSCLQLRQTWRLKSPVTCFEHY